MKRKALRFTSAVFLIVMSILGLIVQPAIACNSDNSAKNFTVQDTDPSNFIFKGSIGNSHKVNEAFAVNVFITNYGQAGKPLTLDYDVPVTVKLKGPGHYEKDYPATLSKGEKYATVYVTCPSAGVWSIYVSGHQEKNGSNKHDEDSDLTLAGPWTFYVGSKDGVVLSIQPSEATMPSGDTKQFQAYFVYSNMEPIDVTDICSWGSSDNNVATVNTAGMSNRLFGFSRVFALFYGNNNNNNENDNENEDGKGKDNGNGNGNNKDDENKSNGNGNVNGNGNGGNGNHYGWQDVGQNAGEYDGQAGLVTADNAGTATITASFDSFFWNYVINPIFELLHIPVEDTATAKVTVMSPTLYITPENPSVAVDDTIQMKAQFVYPDSDKTVDDVTEKATWSSSSNNATVDSKGVVTGVKEGTANISVAYKGKTQSTNVTVIGAQTFQITPQTTDVDLNGTADLKAQIIYADGSSSDVTEDTNWSVDDATIASVDKNGVITGLKLGTTVIKGKYKGKYENSATVTVVNPVLKISPSSPPPTIPINGTIQLQALLGAKIVTNEVNWSVDSSGIATMVAGSPGLFKGLKPGNATITVIYNGQTTSITLIVAQPTLSITTDKTRINTGEPLQLHAYYYDGVNNPSTDVTNEANWSTELFNNCQLGLLTATQEGSITVKASYQGVEAERVIYAVQPKLIISAAPDRASLNVGGSTVKLQAAYIDSDTDNSGIDVTNSAAWSSDDSSVLSVSNIGVVQAFKPGETTIHVSYNGVGGTRVVSASRLMKAFEPVLTFNTTKTKVNVNSTLDLTVLSTDAFGTDTDVTRSVKWETSDPSVLTVSTTGRVTGVKAGKAIVTATYITQDGVTVTKQIELEVCLPTLSVQPSLVLVEVGVTSNTRLNAIYTDADGERDVSSGVTWSSSSPNIASIDSSNGNGVKGNSAGSAIITASYPVPGSLTHEPLTARTSVSVINPQSTKLVIEPYTTSSDVGTKIQYRAYLNGIDVTDQVNWSTSDDNALSIGNVNDANNKKGLAEIKNPAGRPVTITAAYEGITGTAYLKIGPPGVVWEVEPAPQGN